MRDVSMRDVSMRVQEGSVHVIMGPSGAGKSTLIHHLAGFVRAQSGRLLVHGRAVDGPVVHGPPADRSEAAYVPPEARGVAIAPQSPALFGHLTVRENIAFAVPANAGVEVDRVLELLELTHLAERGVGGLSGGEAQRVAVGRALCAPADILLLDEPFAHLDETLAARLRRPVLEYARGANGGQHRTVVWVTHRPADALEFADALTVLCDGRHVQTGTPGELYERPLAPVVAEALGEAQWLPVHGSGATARCALGPVSWPAGGAATDALALVRPDALELRSSAAGAGEVISARSAGAVDWVAFTLDGHRLRARRSAIRGRGEGETLRAGDRVAVSVQGPIWGVIPAQRNGERA